MKSSEVYVFYLELWYKYHNVLVTTPTLFHTLPQKILFFMIVSFFVSVHVINSFFLGVDVKIKEYILIFIHNFTYTLYLTHLLLLCYETRVTSEEYMWFYITFTYNAPFNI